jgi:hypothetical protein
MPSRHDALWAKLSRHSSRPSDLLAHSIHWHLGKSIPWFYATGVALGVPFMSLISPLVLKLTLALMWAMWSTIYLWLAQRELAAHATLFGSLSESEVNRQTGDPWKIAIGVIIALVIWGFGVVGHWTWPSYGPVEWVVIVSSIITALVEKFLTNAWILRNQAAVAGQKRFERET